ncbi:hypothetical protein [Streptomyces sp. HC307]|uniref:hypothetical protein n=1 Tax=Streptomyces flavusporus TaxID=3385496 RepID=UPI003916D4CD
MRNPTENDLTAQRWATQMFGVLTLDGVWTQRLNADRMTYDDMADAADIGRILVDDWKQVTDAEAHKFIRDYVLSNRHTVEQSEAGRALLRRVAGDDGDPWAVVVDSVDGLFAARDSVAEQLTNKIEALHNRTWTPGDLPDHVWRRGVVVLAIALLVIGLPDLATVLGLVLTLPSDPVPGPSPDG